MIHKENNNTGPEPSELQQPMEQQQSPTYLYRWNYHDQVAFDTSKQKKERKKGAFTYTLVLVLVFALCFAMLAMTLVWYRQSPYYGSFSETPLSTADVSDMLKPSTVLIYAQGSSKYSYGTGFFIDANGYIATNYHILEGANSYAVTLYSGKRFEATVVGYSKTDDLAVLKIEGNNYPVVQIGDSDQLREGDTAIAIGHPSGTDAPWSTTQGVISALNRTLSVTSDSYIAEMTMIQTDAALNPGNSGGPLCNDRGEVIGIVARKLNDNEGISFAIPINGAMEILNAIVKDGSAFNVQSSITRVRPRMGITCGTIKKNDTYSYQDKQYVAEKDGVLVSSVDSNGISNGRLFVADIIIALNGTTVTDLDSFTELLYQQKIGGTATLTVWRQGREVTVSLKFNK